MPAEAGIQVRFRFGSKKSWIPVCTGMTEVGADFQSTKFVGHVKTSPRNEGAKRDGQTGVRSRSSLSEAICERAGFYCACLSFLAIKED